MALEVNVGGVLFNLLFVGVLGLGLVSSLFLWGHSQTWAEPPIQCHEFAAEGKLPMGYFMATKTPYQFLAPVKDESLVQDCKAVEVESCIRV